MVAQHEHMGTVMLDVVSRHPTVSGCQPEAASTTQVQGASLAPVYCPPSSLLTPFSPARYFPGFSRGRVVLESPEELKSTWEHRAWTAGACALLAATLAQGLAQVDSLGSAGGAGAAMLAAYFMADVGTAFYHWGVDNYGDANTPMFGGQIAAFQVRGCMTAASGRRRGSRVWPG